MWDADSNEYIDYVGSWGPLILGHNSPEVLEAIIAAPPEGDELWGVDAVGSRSGGGGAGCVSAGGEGAVREFWDRGGMSAIRLARAYTKSKYIIKFEGCYHGHATRCW